MKQPNNSGTLIICSLFCQGFISNSLLPQLCALILNYWQPYANTAHTLILEVLHWKEAVPSIRQLNWEEIALQIGLVCCCSNKWWHLQTFDHLLSSRKQSRHVIEILIRPTPYSWQKDLILTNLLDNLSKQVRQESYRQESNFDSRSGVYLYFATLVKKLAKRLSIYFLQ